MSPWPPVQVTRCISDSCWLGASITDRCFLKTHRLDWLGEFLLMFRRVTRSTLLGCRCGVDALCYVARMAKRIPGRSKLMVVVIAAGTSVGCTARSDEGPPVAFTVESSGVLQEPIKVEVELPGLGHMDVVSGAVLNEGVEVATFQFQPGLVFEDEPSADNGWRPPTSFVEGVNLVSVELPGPGNYTFEINEVGYWGGCGTCGHGMSGGSVEARVVGGSLVVLDLGEKTWVS